LRMRRRAGRGPRRITVNELGLNQPSPQIAAKSDDAADAAPRGDRRGSHWRCRRRCSLGRAIGRRRPAATSRSDRRPGSSRGRQSRPGPCACERN
jgi:hypothetical protein